MWVSTLSTLGVTGIVEYDNLISGDINSRSNINLFVIAFLRWGRNTFAHTMPKHNKEYDGLQMVISP